MDLENFLRHHPVLKKLDPVRDQAEVLDFFAKSPMHVAGIELVYDRSPDFSRLLKCQGSEAISILAEHQNKKRLVVSLSTERRWLHGKVENVAYVGDFRTDRSRASAQIWRRHYAELLQAVRDSSSQVAYFLTAILAGNEEALQNLANPKKSYGLKYVPLARMEMVNIYGRLPLRKICKLKTERATPADLQPLMKFLFEREKAKAFGIYFDQTLWNQRSKNWPGFQIENFLLQKNSEGEILACTLPWNPGFAKRMKVTRAPWTLRLLFQILSFFGFSLPSVGESLETVYLTHLNRNPEVDAKQSVESFLNFISSQKMKAHMISFADPTGFSKSMKGWISQRIPVALFLVRREQDPTVDLHNQEISFEMGLV